MTHPENQPLVDPRPTNFHTAPALIPTPKEDHDISPHAKLALPPTWSQ